MKNVLRTFIAIELDRPIRLILKGIQDQLKKSGADVKWVNPEHIHLTLKFLGDVPTEKIDSLIPILKESFIGLFQTNIKEAQYKDLFRSEKRPNIDYLIDFREEKVNKEWKSFSFELTHLGAFPKPENPKIIWAGVASGQDEIKRIVSTLDDKLHSLGFEKEARDFAPHITLGRLRS